MNKDKMIPIDFCRKITPVVVGDVFLNVAYGTAEHYREKEFAVTQGNVVNLNNPDRDHPHLLIVSFADRPNTGKQPVDDDVVVDVYYGEGWHTTNAGGLAWHDDCSKPITEWKLNHAALLAKFKQGANMNNFTEKNTEDATHYHPADNGFVSHFIRLSGEQVFTINDLANYGWKDVGFVTGRMKNTIELSRPIGEREEDHTIDGVLTKAQPQGAKAHDIALMIEALDDNQDEHVKMPVTVPPFSSEYYQSGSEVANTDLHTNRPDWDIQPPCNGEIPKPVFTREMQKAGEVPPVGSVFIAGKIADSRISDFLDLNVEVIGLCKLDDTTTVITFWHHARGVGCGLYGADYPSWAKPIDNRTESQKIIAELLEIWEGSRGRTEIFQAIIDSDKFTITLKGE